MLPDASLLNNWWQQVINLLQEGLTQIRCLFVFLKLWGNDTDLGGQTEHKLGNVFEKQDSVNSYCILMLCIEQGK